MPYPYAVGEKYIYFMIEKVAVPIEQFDMKGDLYSQYYDTNFVKGHVKKMKLKMVQKRKF